MPIRATYPATVLGAIRKNASLKVRAGGGPHRFLAIWAVVVDDRVFVRSWNDKAAGWHRAWREDPAGAILVGEAELEVRAVPVRGERLLDRVSAAYLEKYWRPASLVWSRGMDSPERRRTTLELIPESNRRARSPGPPAARPRRPTRKRAS